MTNEVGIAITVSFGLTFTAFLLLRTYLMKKNQARYRVLNTILEWINVLIPTAFLFSLGLDWKFDENFLPSQQPKDLTFSSFHIAMIGFVVLAIVLNLRASAKESEKNRTFFNGRMNATDYKLLKFGVALVGIEIFKQIVFLNLFSATRPYIWNGFPLQFCSLPIYLFPIIPFLKQGKIKNTLYHYVALYTLIGGLSVMLTGGGVFDLTVSMSLHTMLWHGIMVVAAIYIGVETKVGNNIYNFINATYVFVGSVIFIQIVNTLFHFIASAYPPIGVFDGFYINPFATSTTVPFISALRIKLTEWQFPIILSGFVITVFYTSFITLGGYLLFLLYQTTFKYGELEKKTAQEKTLSGVNAEEAKEVVAEVDLQEVSN